MRRVLPLAGRGGALELQLVVVGAPHGVSGRAVPAPVGRRRGRASLPPILLARPSRSLANLSSSSARATCRATASASDRSSVMRSALSMAMAVASSAASFAASVAARAAPSLRVRRLGHPRRTRTPRRRRAGPARPRRYSRCSARRQRRQRPQHQSDLVLRGVAHRGDARRLGLAPLLLHGFARGYVDGDVHSSSQTQPQRGRPWRLSLFRKNDASAARRRGCLAVHTP